uniref:Decapping nuclease n=1 Tax=Parastrongyloides trichosuri TaxID=131310 RepID=A0A0N4ZJV5_PARTI
MNTYDHFSDLISKPIKIAQFSFDENGKILEDSEKNKMYLYDPILKKKKLSIDLKENFENYEHSIIRYKQLFRSNMLLHFKNINKLKSIKENMNGADFFITRGTLLSLAGAYSDPLNTVNVYWAFNIDNVIIIASKIQRKDGNLLGSYSGLNFETKITTDKDNIGNIKNKSVLTWDQYKEVYSVDFPMPDGKIIKVAYSCEIDAFDRVTNTPIEIKTKFTTSKSPHGTIFTGRRDLSIYLSCLIGNVQNIVIGYKEANYIVSKIEKISPNILCNDEIYYNARLCFLKLKRNLSFIMEAINKQRSSLKCLKIIGDADCNVLSFKCFNTITDEVRELFNDEFNHGILVE